MSGRIAPPSSFLDADETSMTQWSTRPWRLCIHATLRDVGLDRSSLCSAQAELLALSRLASAAGQAPTPPTAPPVPNQGRGWVPPPAASAWNTPPPLSGPD